MKNVYFFILLISSILFFSCKSDKKVTNVDKAIEISTEAPTKERTETYQIFMITVDDLRVREGAKKSTKVMDKLKEGSLVYSNGNQSSFTEKVELRGTQFDSPYQEITYADNKGWIYQGGLYKIYDSGEADSFTADLDNLVLKLNRSKKKLLNKGEEILNVMRQEKSGSPEWNDLMYVLGNYHFSQILQDEELVRPFEEREWSQEQYNSAHFKSYDMQSNSFSKEYSRAGFKFNADEGNVYPIIDPVIIENAIGGPFSESMQSYIALKGIEARTKMFSEGGIVISMNTIVDYIILVENYLTNYPNALGVEEFKKEFEHLNKVLLSGTVNSPSISYETKKLNPQWMEAWNRYTSNNPKGLLIESVKANVEKYK